MNLSHCGLKCMMRWELVVEWMECSTIKMIQNIGNERKEKLDKFFKIWHV